MSDAAVSLSVNVDHVATLRQARGSVYPDPVEAVRLAEAAGAHGITIHLREDRRHINDDDVARIRQMCTTPLNLEMAATDEMLAIAIQTHAELVTLVPERREERTTEGGLNVADANVARVTKCLQDAGLKVSLFIDPSEAAVRGSVALGADAVEFHTGDYAHVKSAEAGHAELTRIGAAATLARKLSPTILIAAGHGLTRDNTEALVARVPEIQELNIGHALISDAVFEGLPNAVQTFLSAIELGVARRAASESK